VEVHRLRRCDLAQLARPSDAASPIRVRHICRRYKLLKQSSLRTGVGPHAPLLHHHIALLVELPRHHVGKPRALQPRPKLQPVLRHLPEILRLVQPRARVQFVRSVALRHLRELVGDHVLLRFGLRLIQLRLQLCQLLLIAPVRIAKLLLVGAVGFFHLLQRNLLRRPVSGANLRRPLERQVLEHVRQSALTPRIVHVAHIHKRRIGEHRRIGPLANQDRQPVGQHLRRDPLLKALQVLRPGRDHNRAHQRRTPADSSSQHPCSWAGHPATTRELNRAYSKLSHPPAISLFWVTNHRLAATRLSPGVLIRK